MVTPGAKAPPKQGKGNRPGFEQGPTVEQLMNFWNMFAMGQKGGGGQYGDSRGGSYSRTVLDERYFRHMQDSKCKGDSSNYRTFITDLLVAVGRLDGRLAKNLKNMLSNKTVEVASIGVSEKSWSVLSS